MCVFVVCGASFVMFCALGVVRCVSFAVRWRLAVGCCLLFVACCAVFVVCDLLVRASCCLLRAN